MGKEEMKKCKNDPYYFYSQYCIIGDDVPSISREQFEMMWNSKELRKTRKGAVIITSTPKGISQDFPRLWNELNQKKMSKEEISPIIKEGIRIMTQVNEGLEIEVVGEMKRTEKSEHYPIGQLGVSTVFRMWGMEERVFLGCQLCEDMIVPNGHLLAEEMVMMTFREQMKQLVENKNGDE